MAKAFRVITKPVFLNKSWAAACGHVRRHQGCLTQRAVGGRQAVAMLYMFLGVCAFSVILSIMATIAQHASSTARRASVLGALHLT